MIPLLKICKLDLFSIFDQLLCQIDIFVLRNPVLDKTQKHKCLLFDDRLKHIQT